MDKLIRFMGVCLDIAEFYDVKGEKGNHFVDDEMLKAIGLGYRALSGYLRQGVTDVIKLQGEYHASKEKAYYAAEYANDYSKQLEMIRAYLDPDMDSKEAIQKIRDILSECEEWKSR